MKILALNGSHRKNGNTSILMREILSAAEQAGASTETLFLGDYQLDACSGCEGCSRSWQCVIRDDYAALVAKLDQADALVLASPTYWYSVTSDMKRFIDRSYSLIQFPHTRKEWISKYQGRGKLCITAAVCEQEEEAMMGDTLSLLSSFARDIGLELVDSVKALGCFAAGSIEANKEALHQAELAGQTLLKRLEN